MYARTLTKNCPFFRQGPPKINQNASKPAHLDKKLQDSLSRCAKEGLFMEKNMVFQKRPYTFVIDFMHFGRDVAEDC